MDDRELRDGITPGGQTPRGDSPQDGAQRRGRLRRPDPLHQMIDACRVDSHDLADSDFAELAAALPHDRDLARRFAAIQNLDQRIATALEDVPIPAGLSQRLFARLAAAPHTVGDAPAVLATVVAPAIASENWRPRMPAVRRMSQQLSQRFVISSLALAATLLVAAFLAVTYLRPPIRVDDVLAFAGNRSTALSPKWNRGAAPADFPLPRSVVARARSWQRVRNFMGQPAVAYQLVDSTGGQATLFAVGLDVPVGATPPVTPQRTTGGEGVAIWRSRGLTYVLVVHGPDAERRYRNFVSPAAPTLAMVPPRPALICA